MHGLGQASRFLTETVQGLFEITGSADTDRLPKPAVVPEERIEVSVDALFA